MAIVCSAAMKLLEEYSPLLTLVDVEEAWAGGIRVEKRSWWEGVCVGLAQNTQKEAE